MFHSPFRVLLDGIKDYPDEEDRRLVLADWIEEHASNEAERARAALIRLQCQRARLGPNDPAGQELEAQEQRLRRAHAPAWVGEWQPWVRKVRDDAVGWRLERGLLRLDLSGLQWLMEVPPDHPTWAWVDGLNLYGLSPEEVQQLTAHPVLAGLNHLGLRPQSFWGPYAGPEVALALAASPHLARLHSLDLTLVVIGPKGAEALAASPHLARLTSLVLWAAGIGSEGARALAQSPYLKHLKSLDLGSYDSTPANEIQNEGIQALARSPHLTNLTHLDLMENNISDEGVRALAESANLRGLTHLCLSGNFIDLGGVRALASSPHLARLTCLMVGGYGFTVGYPDNLVEAAEILLSSAQLPNLTCLDFGYPTYGAPSADMKEAFRQRFGNRVVWGDGQSGLSGPGSEL